jgi:CubicO group peptidase (beta-lactamase class C family)
MNFNLWKIFSLSCFIILNISTLVYANDNKENLESYKNLNEKNDLSYDKIYLSRLKSLFSKNSGQNGGLIYDPLENIVGSDKPIALDVNYNKNESSISFKALKDVENYARINNSLALFVWRNNKLELKSFFNGTNEDTLIVGKSLAKPITVMAIGIAIKKGFIKSLDQSVSDFITEWKNTKKESILVRHLLDMRSGFLRQGYTKDPKDILNLSYLHPFHDEIIINDYPLTHKPGTRYDYSNATSEMIAPLIEKATGKKYEQWLSEELFTPLNAKGGKIWLNRNNGTAHSGCCILLPAETFFKIGLLSLFDGKWYDNKILPTGFIKKTKETTPQNIWSGMGLYVGEPYKEFKGYANPEFKNLMRTYHSKPYLSKDLYLFDGNSNQVIYIIPSENLIIMRLGNPPPKNNSWDNAYIPNTIIKGILR